MKARSDKLCMASGTDGTLWLILQTWQSASYVVRRNDSWTKVEPIPSQGWKFINRITAAVDETDHPVVVWTGFDQTPGEAVAFCRWDGSAWTIPQVLDRLPTCKGVNELHSLRDREGVIHIAYDRPLDPPESYGLFEGMFPNKCWHTSFNGEQWSTPKPTTGRVKLHIRPVGLSLGPDGHLVVAEEISPHQEHGYIGEQVWDGTNWTQPKRLTDQAGGGMIATPWGDRLVWWMTYPTLAVGACLLQDNRETSIPWSYWNGTVPITNDPAGRIVVYIGNQQTVQVWNGDRWSISLGCGVCTDVIATADGKVWLANWQSDRVSLQEILVRELASSPPATRAAASP